MSVQELSLRPATRADLELTLRWANDPVTRRSSFHGDEIDRATHADWFERSLAGARRLYIAESSQRPVGIFRLDPVEDVRSVVGGGLGDAVSDVASDGVGDGVGDGVSDGGEHAVSDGACDGVGDFAGNASIDPAGTHARQADAEVSMTVAPEARGRGIARALLVAGIDKAGTLGMARLLARIRSDNAASLGLFTAAGFVRIGETECNGVAATLLIGEIADD